MGVCLQCLVGFSWRANELGDVKILDARIPFLDGSFLPYKPDEVNTLFDQLDKKDNLALYKYSEITVDLAFPICYAILLTGLINWLRHNQPLWIKRMPLFALVADLSENTIIFLMATAPDEINQLVATIAALTTLVKWSALLLILVIILSQLVFRLKDLKRFKDSDTIDKYIPSG